MCQYNHIFPLQLSSDRGFPSPCHTWWVTVTSCHAVTGEWRARPAHSCMSPLVSRPKPSMMPTNPSSRLGVRIFRSSCPRKTLIFGNAHLLTFDHRCLRRSHQRGTPGKPWGQKTTERFPVNTWRSRDPFEMWFPICCGRQSPMRAECH